MPSWFPFFFSPFPPSSSAFTQATPRPIPYLAVAAAVVSSLRAHPGLLIPPSHADGFLMAARIRNSTQLYVLRLVVDKLPEECKGLLGDLAGCCARLAALSVEDRGSGGSGGGGGGTTGSSSPSALASLLAPLLLPTAAAAMYVHVGP